MPRTRFAPAGLALLLALSGCDTPPAPPPVDPTPPSDPQSAKTTGAPAAQLIQLDNGLATYLEIAPRGMPSQITFGVFAGSLFMAPGLAELTAHVIVQSADPKSGRRSLAQQIRAAGGTVDVNVGLTSTWIDIRVPAGREPTALAALRAALESVTRSRRQIERMRDTLVAETCERTLADMIGATARSLLHAQAGTGPRLEGMLDLDPSQVGVFVSRMYRPDRCVLAMRCARKLDKMLGCATTPPERAIAEWRPEPGIPGANELLQRHFQSGLYWHEPARPGPDVRIALVLQLPEPGTPLAGPLLTMQACLTLDGRGGRLEQLQAEAGLAHLQWHARFEQTADVSALVLESRGTREEAIAMWRVLNRARSSLVEVPPTESELRLALRRAFLGAGLSQLDGFSRLRRSVLMATRGASWATTRTQLRHMADLKSWDPTNAAAAFQETPAWMIAIGGGKPADLPDLREFQPFPEGFDPKSPSTPTPEVLASADPWLARARAALGGDQAFRDLLGFSAEAHTETEGAPAADDRLQWSHDGTLHRQRTVLGAEIVTDLRGATWNEQLDGVTRSLDDREARALRHEAQRHPLMLLAAHLRGDLQFRPVAQRTIGDRELMVLEAVGDTFERLRIYIDVESHLIRTVESWEHTADGALVHVQESWSDYRVADGVRAPFRRRSTWDDGLHRAETTFTSWRPTFGG